MTDMSNFDEVIDFAIAREQEAAAFYVELAGKVQGEWTAVGLVDAAELARCVAQLIDVEGEQPVPIRVATLQPAFALAGAGIVSLARVQHPVVVQDQRFARTERMLNLLRLSRLTGNPHASW